MVVEDQVGVRTLIREVLQGSGYTVLEAGHGVEALAICDCYPAPIQLLLTDVVMPEMSATKLADAVLHRRSAIKVLFMSGYTDDAIVRHGILTEGTSFLQKPFTPIGLARKVREVLDREPANGATETKSLVLAQV